MKIWLPDPLYRLKPLILGVAGASLLYVSENLLTTVLAVLCLGYACWIILIRLMWSTAETIKPHLSSTQAGQQKTHHVKYRKY